jgi:hypothetical protein
VSFLTTLVTYPFVYLLLARAARGEGALGGFMLDGRRRLEDFPEGRAIVDLERCLGLVGGAMGCCDTGCVDVEGRAGF